MRGRAIRIFVAATLWAVATILTVVDAFDGATHDEAPWRLLAVTVAAVFSLACYIARRAERIEGEAFERGLRAGASMREHLSDGRRAS